MSKQPIFVDCSPPGDYHWTQENWDKHENPEDVLIYMDYKSLDLFKIHILALYPEGIEGTAFNPCVIFRVYRNRPGAKGKDLVVNEMATMDDYRKSQQWAMVPSMRIAAIVLIDHYKELGLYDGVE